MIYGRKFFDQLTKNEKIKKNCYQSRRWFHNPLSLKYYYLKENYKFIAADLSRQQAFDADRKAIQQIKFTGDLNQIEIQQCFSFLKK